MMLCYNSTSDIMKEMITQRLNDGFQLCSRDGSCVLSTIRAYHVIKCDADGDRVNVTVCIINSST